MPSFFSKVPADERKGENPTVNTPNIKKIKVLVLFLDRDVMTLWFNDCGIMWCNDFVVASVHCDLLYLFFLFVLQRAVHHYPWPWSYFDIAPELARKRHQGKLLLNFNVENLKWRGGAEIGICSNGKQKCMRWKTHSIIFIDVRLTTLSKLFSQLDDRISKVKALHNTYYNNNAINTQCK